jgi:hypothetical protein
MEENQGAGQEQGGGADQGAAAAAAAAAAEQAGRAAEQGNGAAAVTDERQTVSVWADLDEETKQFVGEKTPAQVAKELRDAQKLIGKKTIGIPGKDSTLEEQAAYHKARGVPDSEDGYQIDDVLEELQKEAPEGFARDKEREAHYRKLFKAANLSNSEARELIKRELAGEFEKHKVVQTEKANLQRATADMITKEWGPKADENKQDANVFLRHVGVDEDALAVVNAALGTKPEARFKFLEFAREQGRMLREGGTGMSDPRTVNANSLTPEQARVAKQEFISKGDNQAAYFDPSHARHKEVMATMTNFLMAEKGIKKAG